MKHACSANTHIPSPWWAATCPVQIPLSCANDAADVIIDWFGPEELKVIVGGERWWQVRLTPSIYRSLPLNYVRTRTIGPWSGWDRCGMDYRAPVSTPRRQDARWQTPLRHGRGHYSHGSPGARHVLRPWRLVNARILHARALAN
jgi:hypothetical protein